MGSDDPEQAPDPRANSLLRSMAKATTSAALTSCAPRGAEQKGDGDGLRPLAVGVRRQDFVFLVLRPLGEVDDEVTHASEHRRTLVADVQAQVEGHLVISRPRRVQASRNGPEPPPEFGLHGHVDVFFTIGHLQCTRIRLLEEVPQTPPQGQRVVFRHEANAGQHGDVGHASEEVFPRQRAVEA